MKVSRRVTSNAPYLRVLKDATPKNRVSLLKTVPDSTIHAILECTHAALTNKIPLKPRTRCTLRRHKRAMISVLRPGLSIRQRRQKLVQRGGFIGTLIGALAAGIPALISALQR